VNGAETEHPKLRIRYPAGPAYPCRDV
jgi:hypothetical protein